MKVTYINHSGFAIETNDVNIIIDFYKDTTDIDGYIYKEILPATKKLYVLTTHSHLDHYNGEVLNWKRKVKDITYIFHKDVLETGMASREDAIYLDKLQEYKDANIYIKTYGSTDIGGSFYIEVDGKKIFHAGDLNNWHWNEESTPAEIKEAEDNYAKELTIISADITQLDMAMFPIDPRLGKDFMKGAEQFLSSIDTKILAPMHFDLNYNKIALFEPIAKKHGSNYMLLTKTGQNITLL